MQHLTPQQLQHAVVAATHNNYKTTLHYTRCLHDGASTSQNYTTLTDVEKVDR